MDEVLGREAPGMSKSDIGLDWHELQQDGPPPEAAPGLIFWGERGLRTVPGLANIGGYIEMWPEEYRFWAVVPPPGEA